jgi:hypothetical protein
MRTLVFDMDNTINKFYDVEGWLNDFHNEDVRPYVIAEPKYDMTILNEILLTLKALGWRIAITTWLAKDSTKEYDDKVRKAKIDWLKKYGFPYDEIHIIKYGVTKANSTRHLGGYQILIDDNDNIRKGWSLGSTINANENILKELVDLICKEVA